MWWFAFGIANLRSRPRPELLRPEWPYADRRDVPEDRADRSQAKYRAWPRHPLIAGIAQLVERIIRNDEVGGSNPSAGTTY